MAMVRTFDVQRSLRLGRSTIEIEKMKCNRTSFLNGNMNVVFNSDEYHDITENNVLEYRKIAMAYILDRLAEGVSPDWRSRYQKVTFYTSFNQYGNCSENENDFGHVSEIKYRNYPNFDARRNRWKELSLVYDNKKFVEDVLYSILPSVDCDFSGNFIDTWWFEKNVFAISFDPKEECDNAVVYFNLSLANPYSMITDNYRNPDFFYCCDSYIHNNYIDSIITELNNKKILRECSRPVFALAVFDGNGDFNFSPEKFNSNVSEIAQRNGVHDFFSLYDGDNAPKIYFNSRANKVTLQARCSNDKQESVVSFDLSSDYKSSNLLNALNCFEGIIRCHNGHGMVGKTEVSLLDDSISFYSCGKSWRFADEGILERMKRGIAKIRKEVEHDNI